MKLLFFTILVLFSINGYSKTVECKGETTLSLASGGPTEKVTTKVLIDQDYGKYGLFSIILDGRRYEGLIKSDDNKYFYSFVDISRSETYVFIYTKKGKDIQTNSSIMSNGKVYLNITGLLKCAPYSPKE